MAIGGRRKHCTRIESWPLSSPIRRSRRSRRQADACPDTRKPHHARINGPASGIDQGPHGIYVTAAATTIVPRTMHEKGSSKPLHSSLTKGHDCANQSTERPELQHRMDGRKKVFATRYPSSFYTDIPSPSRLTLNLVFGHRSVRTLQQLLDQ